MLQIYSSVPSACLINLKPCFNISGVLLKLFPLSPKTKTSFVRKRNKLYSKKLTVIKRLKLMNLVINKCQSQSLMMFDEL